MASDDDSLLIFYSLVIYVIWLGVLATIPLNIKGIFTGPQQYKYYKLFWWITSLAYANLFLWVLGFVLTGKVGELVFYCLYMITLVIVMLLPTLLPAAYQYHKKINNIDSFLGMYSRYKLYWWIVSIIFINMGLLIFSIILGVFLDIGVYGFVMILLVIIMGLLPTFPSIYQYRKKSKQQGAE